MEVVNTLGNRLGPVTLLSLEPKGSSLDTKGE